MTRGISTIGETLEEGGEACPELCWTIPEPQHQLLFFDNSVTSILPNGDGRDRLKNYLGRFPTKERLKLYRRIAQAKRIPKELDILLAGVDRKELAHRSMAVMKTVDEIDSEMKITGARGHIQKFVQLVLGKEFDERDYFIPKTDIITF